MTATDRAKAAIADADQQLRNLIVSAHEAGDLTDGLADQLAHDAGVLTAAAIAAIDRAAAAEKVCVLVGWTAARQETDRDKALHELWREWSDLPGVSTNPEDHPDLSDEVIGSLARRRDEKRAEFLAKL